MAGGLLGCRYGVMVVVTLWFVVFLPVRAVSLDSSHGWVWILVFWDIGVESCLCCFSD